MSVSTRIEITDSAQGMVMNMSGGNPGAMSVCVRILKEGDRIDPNDALGGFGALLSLDSLGIYNDKIWMLYKDVCKGDLPDMMALLRACQLGFLAEGTLKHAIQNHGKGLDVPEMCSWVAARLPDFKFTPQEV